MKPGAALTLQWRLRHPHRESPDGTNPVPMTKQMSTHPFGEWQGGTTPSDANSDPQNSSQQNRPAPMTSQPQTGSFASSPTSSLPAQAPSASALNARNSPAVQSPVPQQPRPELQWLLMCSKPYKLPTSLTHLDLGLVFKDKTLFRAIRTTAQALKSRWQSWLSLKGIRTIKFVKVGTAAASAGRQISY